MKNWIIIAALLLSLNSLNVFAQNTERISIDGHHEKLSAILQRPSLGDGQKCDLVIVMHGFMGNKDGRLQNGFLKTASRRSVSTLTVMGRVKDAFRT